jgi:hypothetical protein
LNACARAFVERNKSSASKGETPKLVYVLLYVFMCTYFTAVAFALVAISVAVVVVVAAAYLLGWYRCAVLCYGGALWCT